MAGNELDRHGSNNNSHSPFYQRRIIPYEKYFRSLFLFSLILSSLYLLDALLPARSSEEEIEEWFVMIEDEKMDQYTPLVEQLEGFTVYYKIRTKTEEISLHKEDAVRLHKGDQLMISRSFLFKTILSIESIKDNVKFSPYLSGYGIFLVIPFILILTALLGLLKRWRDDLLYSLAVIQILTLGAFIVIRMMYM
jgi:hypothetical protein